MKIKGMVWLTGFLVMVLVLCISNQAFGSEPQNDYRSEYYRNIEKAYTDAVRASLDDMGYRNAGVTMTRMVNEGFVEYTITVHHSRIDALDEAERCELTDLLLMEPIQIENSTVSVRYLEYM